jgi:hypothetical protein
MMIAVFRFAGQVAAFQAFVNPAPRPPIARLSRHGTPHDSLGRCISFFEQNKTIGEELMG